MQREDDKNRVRRRFLARFLGLIVISLAPVAAHAQIEWPPPIDDVQTQPGFRDVDCLSHIYSPPTTGTYPLASSIPVSKHGNGTIALDTYIGPGSAVKLQNVFTPIVDQNYRSTKKPDSIDNLCVGFAFSLTQFLWLTSPTGQNSGERVFESSLMFDLSPDARGRYDLIQKKPGVVPNFRLRVGKKTAAGAPDILQGEATGDVLMAQPQGDAKHGSLVYYQISVNDVYAYFRTGVVQGAIKAPAGDVLQFPTTKAELDAIASFAAAHGLAFASIHGHDDRDALAIELKTAWVEAADVPKGCTYITQSATIPSYDTSNPHKWVPKGTKTTTLALVGMHLVTSIEGHPEMLWSTFEHICNAPNAAYSYLRVGDRGQGAFYKQEVWAQDTKGHWLFARDGSKGPFNVAHMGMSGADIVSQGGKDSAMAPSDLLRVNAWGSSDAHVNSLVFTLNSLRRWLAPDDLRRNYVLIGSLWSERGQAPTANDANHRGATALANTSMESFIQGPSTSCFTCHLSGSGKKADTNMSHVFRYIDPLAVSAKGR